MSELSKEELIEKLKINKRNCSDSWDRGYNIGLQNAIYFAKHLPDKPSKPVVPKYPKFIIDWFEGLLNGTETKKFGGNDVFRIIQDVIKVSNEEKTWEDYNISEKIMRFAEENEELFLNLIVNCSIGNGYEVEQPKEYAVKVRKQHYFKDFYEAIEENDIFCYEQAVDVYYAHLFTNKRKAELVAELIGGEVEEV